MLVMKKNNLVKWPVTVTIPEDGGTVKKFTVTATFKMVTQSRYMELSASGLQDDILKSVLVNLADIGFEDDNNEPCAYSQEKYSEQVGEFPALRNALFLAYWRLMEGEAAEKN